MLVEGGVDPAAQGAKQEDRYYNNKSFQRPDVDPGDTSHQDAALKIQTKYRQYHAKKVSTDQVATTSTSQGSKYRPSSYHQYQPRK